MFPNSKRWDRAAQILDMRGYIYEDEIPDVDAADELCEIGWLEKQGDRYYLGELAQFGEE